MVSQIPTRFYPRDLARLGLRMFRVGRFYSTPDLGCTGFGANVGAIRGDESDWSSSRYLILDLLPRSYRNVARLTSRSNGNLKSGGIGKKSLSRYFLRSPLLTFTGKYLYRVTLKTIDRSLDFFRRYCNVHSQFRGG
jgi:hypothetical protein